VYVLRRELARAREALRRKESVLGAVERALDATAARETVAATALDTCHSKQHLHERLLSTYRKELDASKKREAAAKAAAAKAATAKATTTDKKHPRAASKPEKGEKGPRGHLGAFAAAARSKPNGSWQGRAPPPRRP